MHTWVLDKPDNLVEMYEETLKKYADNKWFGTKNANKIYEWVTYRQTAERIDNCRAGLKLLGIDKGGSVGIISQNSVEWAIACYATYGLGAQYIPMYKAELVKIWKYIIQDSLIKVLFVSDDDIYNTVKDWVKEIPTLTNIIKIYGTGENTMSDLEQKGKASPVTSIYPGPDDTAGLIYTSGTTGDPKGVALTHGNLTSNVHAILKRFHMASEADTSLSFLPWAHSYGQTVELNVFMRLGASVAFAENSQTIIDDLALVKPTMLIAVPRIFNRVYDGLQAKMNEDGGLAKFLFDMGVKAGQVKRELALKARSSLIANFKFAIADMIVFSKIRLKFGGRLKHSISSSAALSPHIAAFFYDIGIPVYEAWGMTEISPAGAVSSPDSFKIGSSGKAIDKMKFVIDKSLVGSGSEDGELIVYGPNVMKGYHNKPADTKEIFNEDGGLKTGDRAYIDPEGFLYITGRIKEEFKLENGKFVYPSAIEEEIKLIPYVEQAMIYGLNRLFTVCLVYPDAVVMEKFAKKHNLPADLKSLVKEEVVIKEIENAIKAQLNEKFGSYEIPKKFLILDEGFSVDNGMLTQTFKLKRREVLKKYQAAINALYS